MAAVTLLEYTIRPLRRIRSLSSDTRWNLVYTVYSGGQRFRSLTWLRWYINKKSAKKFKILQPNRTFFFYSDVVSTRYYLSYIVPVYGWRIIVNYAFLCFIVHVQGSLPIVNNPIIVLDNSTCCNAYGYFRYDFFFRRSMFIVIPCS